jgi:hypothetical protein
MGSWPRPLRINPCKSARMLIYSVENVARAGKLEEAADQVLLLLE